MPQGASVFSPDNAFLTSVVGEGMVFLNNLDESPTLSVSCRIQPPVYCNSTLSQKPMTTNSTKQVRQSAVRSESLNRLGPGLALCSVLLWAGLMPGKRWRVNAVCP